MRAVNMYSVNVEMGDLESSRSLCGMCQYMRPRDMDVLNSRLLIASHQDRAVEVQAEVLGVVGCRQGLVRGIRSSAIQQDDQVPSLELSGETWVSEELAIAEFTVAHESFPTEVPTTVPNRYFERGISDMSQSMKDKKRTVIRVGPRSLLAHLLEARTWAICSPGLFDRWSWSQPNQPRETYWIYSAEVPLYVRYR